MHKCANVENCGKIFFFFLIASVAIRGKLFRHLVQERSVVEKHGQSTDVFFAGRYFLPTIYRNAGRKLLFCRYRQKCRVCNGGGFATYCLRTVSKILCGKPPLRKKAFKHFVNDSALLQTELIHMCVRLLHIRVQVFVTVPFFCLLFCFFFKYH